MAHPIDDPGFIWLFNAAPDAMLVVGRDGGIVAANPQAERTFGRSRAELVSLKVEDLMPERFRASHPSKREAYHAAPRVREMGSGTPFVTCLRDGTEFPADISLSPLEMGVSDMVLVALRDVSERRRAEERLFRERERAFVTLASIADAVITADSNGIIDFVNPAAEVLTGWTSSTAAGQPLHVVLPLVAEGSGEVESPASLGLRQGQANPEDQVCLRRRDGSLLPVAYTVAPIGDQAGRVTGIAVVFRDVEEQRRLARRLSHEATHDSLTGLVNRAEFERRLGHAVERVGTGTPATLCYLDLDRFKAVNDSCGHQAGDEVLRQVATIMNGALRQRDTLARLGGDEFVALLENCTMPEGIRVASKIQRAVTEHRFAWHDRSFYLGISVGAVAIQAGSTREALLLAADAACYRSKAGGGRFVEVASVDEGGTAERSGGGAATRQVAI
jgi:diguanylate cyclase (GGDEF)-like protein/PAS domain S-box-containing protein